jgi:hypothetical protein
LRIGADWFHRHGLVVAGSPRGVVDRIDALAQPGLDTARIHPDVIAFFEDTAALDLVIKSHWRFPFSLAWRALRPLMHAIGQFVLPLPLRTATIETRVLALDAERDGRSDVRAVIRRYAGSGAVMQAVAYATFTRDQRAHFMSATFPLPLGQVAGFLRLEALPDSSDDDGRTGAALTSTRAYGDDAGIWIVLGPIAFRAPLSERLSLWAPGMRGAPAELDVAHVPRATVVARHEQRVFGVRFATHDYWFYPSSP